MIEVTRIRIQKLNGTSLVTSKRELPVHNRFFKTSSDLEIYRKKKEAKLQFKSDQQYRKENPMETEEDINKHAPKISVLLDTKDDNNDLPPLNYAGK